MHILANHPYARPTSRRWQPCVLHWRLQILVLVPMFGFVQTKIERWGSRIERDNYFLIGAPNGGGVWQEF